jgi:hypothetical protein
VIYDCVSFYNELDILELRLRELAPAVDHFVIVEAMTTHKGDRKPLYYAENAARFRAWHDKIIHVVVADMPEGDGPPGWRRREMWQRNAILRGLRGAKDDDMVLISDADEIPRAGLIPPVAAWLADTDGGVVTFSQKLYYYNLNTHAPDRPWPGTRAARYADVRALSPHIIRNGMGQPDPIYPNYAAAPSGGWHFSYFGDAEHIRNKQTQFLHQELVTPDNTALDTIRARVAAGVDIWGREHEQQFVIGPADDLPHGLLEDIGRWTHLFAPGWEPEFHEAWYDGGQALYMAALARTAPDGAIVEIGCWEGRSTVTLAQAVAPKVVHCVDHWEGNPDEAADHPATIAAAERDVMATFMHNRKVLTADNTLVSPMSWQNWIAYWDQPTAFVHIDAAHDYQSVYDCITALRPFLVPGAILCGDDAYSELVWTAVQDALPGAEVMGKRLWVWRNE